MAVGRMYPWAVVAMLWCICFFNYADRQAIAAILPALESEYHFSKTQLGWIGAAFMYVYAITAPFAGGTGDRVSRKLLIIGGLYVWSIVTGFTAACARFWQFVFVRGAEGLGETFYFPASMSLISDYHGKRTRSRAMGLHQTSVYAGTIGGSWFAGWMAVHYDWRYPFVILGAGGVVLGLVLMALIREPARDEAERRDRGELVPRSEELAAAEIPSLATRTPWPRFVATTVAEVVAFFGTLFRNPPALVLISAFCGANIVAFIFITWMPSYLHDEYGLNLAQAGFAAAVYMQVASMVGSAVGGVLADRARKGFAGGRAAVQAVGVVAACPFIYWCGYTTQLTSVLVAMTGFGFAKGIYDSNIWASLYDVVPAEKRSTAVGVTNMVGWLGAGLGTTGFGVALDRGFPENRVLSSTVVIYMGIAGLLVLASILTARRPAAAGH
jgi:MFS family permease